MDILRIFRMQEPVSKELLTKSNELGKYKEVSLEKDVLLKNHLEKIKDLENELAELKLKYVGAEHQVKLDNMGENEFLKVMLNYDDFFTKGFNERQELICVNAVLNNQVKNWECAFNDLLKKYSSAKIVVQGLIENQEALKNDLHDYEDTINKLEQKYDLLRNYSESKITEANCEIHSKEKGNIQEVAKLKAKILQSQAKINALEKHVKIEKTCTKTMFDPLKNKIGKN